MRSTGSAEKRKKLARNLILTFTASKAGLLGLLLAGGCKPSMQINAPEREAPAVSPACTAAAIPIPNAPPTTDVPTAMPIEPLILTDEGVGGWCLPLSFAGIDLRSMSPKPALKGARMGNPHSELGWFFAAPGHTALPKLG